MLEGTTRLIGDGGVHAIAVDDGGQRYASAPAVSIAGTGTGAVAQATLGVASVRATRLGGGYTSAPAVAFSPPDIAGGRCAAAIAVVGGQGAIERIQVTDVGSGYLVAPSIAITGGGGAGAAAEAVCCVADIAVVAPGHGYDSPPIVTLDGGGGTGARATAHTQRTLIATTDPAGAIALINRGTLDQQGALLLLARGGATFDERAHGSFRNEGTWTIAHGAFALAATSGLPPLGPAPCVNAGTLALLDDSSLSFAELENTGTLRIVGGALLGSLALTERDLVLRNGAKGTIAISGRSAARPVRFGLVGDGNSGRRALVNGGKDAPATLEIGGGTDGTTVVFSGGNCGVENAAGSRLAVRTGATLALITNDGGHAQGSFAWRESRLLNHGLVELAGTLELCGNQWGPIGFDSDGTTVITGAASIHRLQDSSHGAGACTWAVLANRSSGTITGDGTLTYVDDTSADAERSMLLMLCAGTVAPGRTDLPEAQRPKEPSSLTFVGADLVLDAKSWVAPRANAGFPAAADCDAASTVAIGMFAGAGACDRIGVAAGTGRTRGGSAALASQSGSVLDVHVARGVVPKGEYTVLTAAAVTGRFDRLRYRGADQVPYTVKYSPTAVSIVFP